MKNNMKDNIEFGNRLTKLREEKGFTQEELAEKLGVSRQIVSVWERGQARPKTDRIIKLSEIYNLSMEEILYGKDETKPAEIETKVVSESDTQIIENTKNEIGNEIAIVNVKFETENKKENFIKKHLRKIIAILLLILLLAYLGLSVYKFFILKDINDKYNEFKNSQNCYLERKELVTNNETGTAYILNNRYWYKDGLLRIEEIRTENGVTKTINTYINLNKEEKYKIYENTNKIIKKQDIYGYEGFENGILEHIIEENYYKYNNDMIKSSFDILKNINISKDKYIKKSISKDSNLKKVYNKENAFIEQIHDIKENEEIKILYDIQIDMVRDEDVKIEYLDLSNYQIIEQ